MKNETSKYFLKDIATIVAGQSPESKYYNTNGEGLPFFQGKADFGALYPKVRMYCSQPTKIAEKDDILLSVRAPVGPTNLSPGKVCIGRGLAAIRPGKEVRLKYLLYFFRYYETQLQRSGTGTTFKAITQNVIKNIEVPVPDTEDQERIVSKIEELFSKLDASVAELQTAKEKLEVYRQAVLEESLPNSTSGAISEYIESIGQGWSPKCANKNSLSDDVWAVIKTTAVQHGYFNYTENKILPDSLEPKKQHLISVGDILITRAGPRSRCGVCCLVRKTKQRLLNCDKVYQIKPNIDKIIPEYLEYVLNSSRFLLEINHCKTGGNDSGVNLTQSRFLSIKIPVPSIDTQKQIIDKIESRLSLCDSIEQTIGTSLQQAEALRQSILKQAFEGKI